MDKMGRDETMDGARTRRTQRASNNSKSTTTMRKVPTKRDGVDATGRRDSPRSALNMPRSASFSDSAGGDDEETKEKNERKTTKEKMEPSQVAKTFDRQWVKIGDVEYDITDMKHPGGSVIYYMLSNVGADATEAFREFHYRSKKAEKMLKLLPQRIYDPKNHRKDNNSYYQEVDTSDSAMLKDFAQFRLGLEKEGFFTPSPAHVLYRIVELMFTFALATYLMAKGFTACSVITYGAFFGARCGWVQHEGGHNSLTGNIWIDKRIQACLMGFGLGTSGDMWNIMHNKHHATPQKIRHDMDLDTTPAVAFFNTAVEENRERGFSRLWSRFQAWTFVPITSGVFVMAFWLYVLHPSKVMKKKNFEEAAWMLSSHVVRASLIQFVHPANISFAHAYGLYALSMWVAGMYLFAHFSTSHTHTKVVEFRDHPSWVRYAVEHTVDISPHNACVNWLMGYLNLQVIHHLFPNAPQFKQPEISKRFKVFAEKWGLEYTVMTYGEAWKATFKNLNDVGMHYYEEGTFRKNRNAAAAAEKRIN